MDALSLFSYDAKYPIHSSISTSSYERRLRVWSSILSRIKGSFSVPMHYGASKFKRNHRTLLRTYFTGANCSAAHHGAITITSSLLHTGSVNASDSDGHVFGGCDGMFFVHTSGYRALERSTWQYQFGSPSSSWMAAECLCTVCVQQGWGLVSFDAS
jgi:hypothetical protein